MENLLHTVRLLLAQTPARWENLARLPVELFTRAPAPDEWSALDCLQHLIDTERMAWATRVRAVLSGGDFPGFDPDTQGTRPAPDADPVEMAAEFARFRSVSLEVLAQVSQEDLPRTARHEKLGLVTMQELLDAWTAHDLNHTVQAERALMQPFIAGSGPFRFRFRDHDVER